MKFDMSDENVKQTESEAKGSNDLIAQVKGELTKGKREAVKAKLKEILKKREEAEKTLRALDLEAQKVVDDFNNGLL
jgi:hypothetical protein